MRLIDADALKSKIREQSWKQETKVSLMLDWIYMLIDEASTVSTVQNKALQAENEQLKADLRGKDNEINDLKALIEYLRKFKPKKNEAVREGSV